MADQLPKRYTIPTAALWLIAAAFAIASVVTYLYVIRPSSIRKECDRIANENILSGLDYSTGYTQCVHAHGLSN